MHISDDVSKLTDRVRWILVFPHRLLTAAVAQHAVVDSSARPVVGCWESNPALTGAVGTRNRRFVAHHSVSSVRRVLCVTFHEWNALPQIAFQGDGR